MCEKGKIIINRILKLSQIYNTTKYSYLYSLYLKHYPYISKPTFYKYIKMALPKKSLNKISYPKITYLNDIWAVDFINLKFLPKQYRVKRTFTKNIKVIQFTYFKHNKPIKTYFLCYFGDYSKENFYLTIAIAKKLGIKKLVIDRQFPKNLNTQGIQLYLWSGKHKSPIEYFGFIQKTIHYNRQLKTIINNLAKQNKINRIANIVHTLALQYFKSIPIFCLNHFL